ITAQQVATYNAIRNAGNNTIILMSAGVGSGDPGAVGKGSGLDEAAYGQMRNIGWDLHFYGWMTGYSTDQATVTAKLQGSANSSTGILAAQAIMSADGIIPLIIGEYGDSTTGESRDANWIQNLTAVHTSGFGTAAWHWGVLGNADILNHGNQLTDYGQIVAEHIRTGY
ncbi:MAG: cellulase family glycosylhydrolase, partial [Bdellovibrionales bacterium]